MIRLVEQNTQDWVVRAKDRNGPGAAQARSISPMDERALCPHTYFTSAVKEAVSIWPALLNCRKIR
jgi:hypothetical protein